MNIVIIEDDPIAKDILVEILSSLKLDLKLMPVALHYVQEKTL